MSGKRSSGSYSTSGLVKMYRIYLEKSRVSQVMMPPVSKSDAIRSLVIRFAIGEELIPFADESPEDVIFAQKAIAAIVSGEENLELDLGLGGAPLRFIISLVSMIPGHVYRVSAAEKLQKRPHSNLIASLKKSLEKEGLKLDDSGWPLVIDTRSLQLPEKLEFQLNPSSSQFLSGLLMAGARAVAAGLCCSVEVNLTHELASSQYAAMTLEWLEEAGFEMEQHGNSWSVRGYSAVAWDREVPVDWSSAAYLVALAWRTGSRVAVSSLGGHPDSAILDVLGQAGVRFNFECGGLLRVSGELRRGLHGDALVSPDLIPTLAMIALAAPERSIFENVDILRDKESDRLAFIMEIVEEAGGKAVYQDGRLEISPTESFRDIKKVLTLDDHRRAMAAAILPAMGQGNQVVIDDDKCVAKSFPSFWKEAAKCGLKLEKKND